MAVTLNAQASITDDALQVHYVVETSESVYLVNRVTQWTPDGLSVAPDVIYTDVQNGTLRLTKACLPVPDNLDVEAPDVPWLTAIADLFEESFSLPIPIQPHHPYWLDAYSEAIVDYDDVVLVIGWLPKEIDVRTGTRPDGLEVISARYLDVMRAQQLLVTALNVKVSTHVAHR